MPVKRTRKNPKIEVEIEQTELDEQESMLKYQQHISKIKAMVPAEYLQLMTRGLDLSPSLTSLLAKDPAKTARLPANFVPIYSKIREMRRAVSAAVDVQGCSTLPFFLNLKLPADPIVPTAENFRLQVLVSLMLSSQTKDEMNCKAMSQLMLYCLENLDSEHGISFESLLAIEEQKLDELIQPVGFHTRKAKYIKSAISMIVANAAEHHNSVAGSEQRTVFDVPFRYADIVALPGVGPKMANLLIQAAWGYGEHGIGVDVHVDRLSRMYGWVSGPKEKKDPEETRVRLESMLPISLWTEINHVLVGFGQSVCIPRRQRCQACLLNDICPGRICSKIERTYEGYEDWVTANKDVLPMRTVEGEIEDMFLIKPEIKPEVMLEVKLEDNGIKLEVKLEDEEELLDAKPVKRVVRSKYFSQSKKPRQ